MSSTELTLTCDVSHPLYQKVFNDIQAARSQILDSGEALAENYNLENFNLSEQSALTASYINGELVYFSTIFKRDLYPSGVFRIFNRFWRNPHYRKKYPNKYIPPAVLEILKQQYEFCRFKLNADFVFISREKSHNQWLNHMISPFNEITGRRWFLSDKAHLVCAHRASSGCWQKLLYCFTTEKYKAIPLEPEA